MTEKRHGVDQLIPMLRRADVELSQGRKVPEICKRLAIKQQAYCCWRLDHNHCNPHSSLDCQAPAPFAACCASSAGAYGLAPEEQRNP